MRKLSNVIYHVYPGKRSDLWIIMEYCPHGNLREFLRNSRSRYSLDENDLITDVSQVFGPKNLIQFGLQIAKGMNFLNSRKVISFFKNILVYTTWMCHYIWRNPTHNPACAIENILYILPTRVWMSACTRKYEIHSLACTGYIYFLIKTQRHALKRFICGW